MPPKCEPNEITRTCNLCNELMIGGEQGFIAHGKEKHPNHYMTLKHRKVKFSKKNFWCPLDDQWYSERKWLSQTIRKNNMTNEQYYIKYGEKYLPEVWKKNCSDPVLKDARNHDKCIQCNKPVKFDQAHWYYQAFCSFSCSTTWYAKNTNRVELAMETIKEKRELDPTFCLNPVSIDYWIINHNMTIEEAKEKVRERQSTNSLEAFTKRSNGDEVEGKRLWGERQEKWLATLDKNGWFGNHSKVSKDMFNIIQEKTGLDLRFAENELSIKVKDKVLKPDCALHGTKKIIEFFGDYWHATPTKYNEDSVIRRLDKGGHITAKEIWDRDATRLSLLKDNGYKVMVVWENDYTSDPDMIIQQCIDFFTL